jgi:hypothetical protein
MRFKTALLACPALLLLLAAAATAFDGARPDFGGVWELDQTRSHSIPPDIKQTMTVAQDGDRITVETKIISAQGERVVKDAYALDGKEADFVPTLALGSPTDAPVPKGKRTARWMPNGKGFIVEEEVVIQTEQAPETILIARKWTRWPDGSVSIEIITERGGNAFSNKRVFVKKQ